MNNLYEFKIRVLRGTNKEMPEELIGAVVFCYAAAPDYQEALRKGVSAVREIGHKFEDIEGMVRELSQNLWDDYLIQVWPEFIDQFPDSIALSAIVRTGGVFFGPFLGYTTYSAENDSKHPRRGA